MGSRLRENPRRLLECWCEVVGPQGGAGSAGVGGRPPWISQKFPSSYNDEEVLKSVPQFTYPCAFENSTIQHFSFVLTSLDSKWTYGFCRHAPGSQTAMVLLSHLPWHETFYKLLNHLAQLKTSDQTADLTACLQNVYRTPVPPPGSEISIPYANNKFFVGQCPNHQKLPSIPENRNLLEYYNAVDVDNMVAIFASMLYERRIIFTSRRVSRLSACVQAANLLLYPMEWQHIFIPVLPQHLTDYLLAPMPFLIGVGAGLLSKVHMDDIGEAVILDADANTVQTPFSDAASLPQEVTSTLRRNLRSAHNTIGDGVARAFLRALVQLIGNYKEALQFREDDKRITFNRERFVTLRPPPLQPFAEKMLQLQIFQQFIEERLERLNSGRQTSDDFELEVNLLGERGGSKVKQQYRQFVTSVRKDGGAIIKTMKSKSPFKHLRGNEVPVTKGGKQVKEKSRQTYKEFRGRLKDLRDDGRPPQNWVNGEGGQKKPRSAPTSPTTARRPRSVGNPGYIAKTTYKRSTGTPREDGRARKYDLIEGGSGLMSPASTDSLSTPSPQGLDLMGEMEEIIRARLGQRGENGEEEEEDEDEEDEEEEEDDEEDGRDSSSRSTSNSSSTSNSTRNSIKKNSTQFLSGFPTATVTSTTTANAAATLPHNATMTGAPNPLPPSSLANKKEGGSTQDLIFLESPQDEIFDPLLSKDIPGRRSSSTATILSTTTTTTTTTITTTTGAVKTSHTSSLPRWPPPSRPPSHPPPSVPQHSRRSVSSIAASIAATATTTTTTTASTASKSSSVLGVGADRGRASFHPPSVPPPAPFRPFSTLQTSMGAPVGCQNPMYNAHQPQGPPNRPSTTRAGSAAAAFASSLLGSDDVPRAASTSPAPGPYVQFQPPMASPGSAPAPGPPQRPARLSQKDLLGDFSKDFQKLSLNSKGPAPMPQTAAAAAGMNNNNAAVNNNNKTSSEAKEHPWMTFD